VVILDGAKRSLRNMFLGESIGVTLHQIPLFRLVCAVNSSFIFRRREDRQHDQVKLSNADVDWWPSHRNPASDIPPIKRGLDRVGEYQRLSEPAYSESVFPSNLTSVSLIDGPASAEGAARLISPGIDIRSWRDDMCLEIEHSGNSAAIGTRRMKYAMIITNDAGY